MAQGRHGVLMRISTVADAHLLIHGRGDRVERRRPAVPLRARARNKAALCNERCPLGAPPILELDSSSHTFDSLIYFGKVSAY